MPNLLYSPILAESVQLDLVLRELTKAGIRIASNDLRLDPLAGNPNRHDFLTRKSFRVLSDGEVCCLLITGKRLEDLWKRSADFSAACPAITCRPLCFFQSVDRDYLAFEYFAGSNLEQLVHEQRITPQESIQYAAGIVAQLKRTLQPSTLDAAATEIDTFFGQVCALPLFTGFDQTFLTQVVFPFVRTGALSGTLQTRWSNRDFISRNILVDEQRSVRLIDYEFANRTHFFDEDAWRWQTFSNLPNEAREIPILPNNAKNLPWLEAFCLLRQLVLAHEINGAHMAVNDAHPALLRLNEIVATAHSGFRTSIFLRPLGALPELESKIGEINKNRQKIEQDKEALEKTKAVLEGTNTSLESALQQQEQKNTRLTRLLHKREARLTRMEKSLSWRTAVWLRALRNTFTFSKAHKFHFHLDTPRAWRPYDSHIKVQGWCFAKSRLQLDDIRIQIDRRTYFGSYGDDRADVGLAHPEYPQAYRCGFQIEIDIRAGDQALELAVCDEQDRWHVVCRADLTKDPETIKGSYAHWIREFDTLTEEKRQAIQNETSALPNQPLISIILPTYNTPVEYLTRAIDSVRAQCYERWELCIADDASSAPHVRPLLERYAEQDKRVKITFRNTNGHIAAASNSALSIATGKYIALLDHDDELRPHALAEVVKAINHQPDLQLIYSDEDKIDAVGNRSDPYFKPDWMPELLIGHNYLCHFCVCQADTLRKVGGWRSGFDGAQDWDLQFRITEQAAPNQIVHIPHVLYHWRAVAGSTALATSEKNYVVEAARRAITEHFKRTNENVELVHLPGNHWQAKHALPTPLPFVSLLIPTKNGLKHLRRCIDSIIEKTTYTAYEILIIDNGSDDPETQRYLQQVSEPNHHTHTLGRKVQIRVLPYPRPFNFSALNNFGLGEARGEFVGLLNDDLEVITADWLEEMVAHAARPGVGCVGAKLHFPNNTLQHAGVVLGIGGVAGHAFKGFPSTTGGSMNRAHLAQNYSAVTGACLVVRKSTYEAVHGLDEIDLAVSLNDVDFCLKVRASGFRNLWTPFAEFFHHESATRGYEDTPEKMARFEKERAIMKQRWSAILTQDPAYNPNLTLDSEDFALAYPPRKIEPMSKR